MFKKILSLTVIFCFFLTTLGPLPNAHADFILDLPAPGTLVSVSPNFEPALIRGLTVHQDNPFLFDFIVDPGDEYKRHPERSEGSRKEQLKEESERMIKYFFAALTIPDKDIWVNLSPYEKDRMIPVSLGVTGMGRDLLAQDYMLKQLTASLIYPQKALGKTFWNKVYAKAKEMYGTTQIPVNTFNKVWIVPQKAGVYEHGQTAFIVSGHLKVMLEEDYLAMLKHQGQPGDMFPAKRGTCPQAGCQANERLNVEATQGNHRIASQIIKEIVLPEIEKEINEGKNFATLRQIFYAQVLAVWFKRNLKQALLNQVYANKGTVKGINQNDIATNEAIYRQYLQAYKKGVFNYIKEDIDPVTQETLPRKYFSGGYGSSQAMVINQVQLSNAAMVGDENYVKVTALAVGPKDAAMLGRRLFIGTVLGGGAGGLWVYHDRKKIDTNSKSEIPGPLSIDDNNQDVINLLAQLKKYDPSLVKSSPEFLQILNMGGKAYPTLRRIVLNHLEPSENISSLAAYLLVRLAPSYKDAWDLWILIKNDPFFVSVTKEEALYGLIEWQNVNKSSVSKAMAVSNRSQVEEKIRELERLSNEKIRILLDSQEIPIIGLTISTARSLRPELAIMLLNQIIQTMTDHQGIMNSPVPSAAMTAEEYINRLKSAPNFSDFLKLKEELLAFIKEDPHRPGLADFVADILDLSVLEYVNGQQRNSSWFLKLAYDINTRILNIQPIRSEVSVEIQSKEGVGHEWRVWSKELAREMAEDAVQKISPNAAMMTDTTRRTLILGSILAPLAVWGISSVKENAKMAADEKEANQYIDQFIEFPRQAFVQGVEYNALKNLEDMKERAIPALIKRLIDRKASLLSRVWSARILYQEATSETAPQIIWALEEFKKTASTQPEEEAYKDYVMDYLIDTYSLFDQVEPKKPEFIDQAMRTSISRSADKEMTTNDGFGLEGLSGYRRFIAISNLLRNISVDVNKIRQIHEVHDLGEGLVLNDETLQDAIKFLEEPSLPSSATKNMDTWHQIYRIRNSVTILLYIIENKHLQDSFYSNKIFVYRILNRLSLYLPFLWAHFHFNVENVRESRQTGWVFQEIIKLRDQVVLKSAPYFVKDGFLTHAWSKIEWPISKINTNWPYSKRADILMKYLDGQLTRDSRQYLNTNYSREDEVEWLTNEFLRIYPSITMKLGIFKRNLWTANAINKIAKEELRRILAENYSEIDAREIENKIAIDETPEIHGKEYTWNLSLKVDAAMTVKQLMYIVSGIMVAGGLYFDLPIFYHAHAQGVLIDTNYYYNLFNNPNSPDGYAFTTGTSALLLGVFLPFIISWREYVLRLEAEDKRKASIPVERVSDPRHVEEKMQELEDLLKRPDTKIVYPGEVFEKGIRANINSVKSLGEPEDIVIENYIRQIRKGIAPVKKVVDSLRRFLNPEDNEFNPRLFDEIYKMVMSDGKYWPKAIGVDKELRKKENRFLFSMPLLPGTKFYVLNLYVKFIMQNYVEGEGFNRKITYQDPAVPSATNAAMGVRNKAALTQPERGGAGVDNAMTSETSKTEIWKLLDQLAGTTNVTPEAVKQYEQCQTIINKGAESVDAFISYVNNENVPARQINDIYAHQWAILLLGFTADPRDEKVSDFLEKIFTNEGNKNYQGDDIIALDAKEMLKRRQTENHLLVVDPEYVPPSNIFNPLDHMDEHAAFEDIIVNSDAEQILGFGHKAMEALISYTYRSHNPAKRVLALRFLGITADPQRRKAKAFLQFVRNNGKGLYTPQEGEAARMALGDLTLKETIENDFMASSGEVYIPDGKKSNNLILSSAAQQIIKFGGQRDFPELVSIIWRHESPEMEKLWALQLLPLVGEHEIERIRKFLKELIKYEGNAEVLAKSQEMLKEIESKRGDIMTRRALVGAGIVLVTAVLYGMIKLITAPASPPAPPKTIDELSRIIEDPNEWVSDMTNALKELENRLNGNDPQMVLDDDQKAAIRKIFREVNLNSLIRYYHDEYSAKAVQSWVRTLMEYGNSSAISKEAQEDLKLVNIQGSDAGHVDMDIKLATDKGVWYRIDFYGFITEDLNLDASKLDEQLKARGSLFTTNPDDYPNWKEKISKVNKLGNDIKFSLYYFASRAADKAAIAKVTAPGLRGGIDLSQQDSALQVTKDANGGVKVTVDPALIARIEREGMPEVDPVIINMQPADIKSLFGVEASVLSR